MLNEYGISTRQFSKLNLVQAETVRRAVSNKGHYFGIKPEKAANGRWVWPAQRANNIYGGRAL